MIDWSKYVKDGVFKSTSGTFLPYKFEFDRLEDNPEDAKLILACLLGIAQDKQIVAIETVNPSILRDIEGVVLYNPKTGKFNRKINYTGVVIYDDVTTTSRTMRSCASDLSKSGNYISNLIFVCIVDRQEEMGRKTLNTISIKELLML